MPNRIIEYRCSDCQYVEEELFVRNEEIPNTLNHYCPNCGGILRKFDFKNNSQAWKWRDKK